MRKMISCLMASILVLALSVPAFAGTIKGDGLTAKATTNSITVSGSTESGVKAAVVVQVLDAGNQIIAMESFPVNDQKFDALLSGLNLPEGSEYTVHVADYDGGSWQTVKAVVPVTPVYPSIPSTPTDSSETVEETKPDGTVVKTETETKPDGTVVETVTETAKDGSVTETKTETAKDGTVSETKTETAKDGTVSAVTEKTSIPEVEADTSATVVEKKDGNEKVKSSAATVTKTVDEDTTKVTLSGAVVDQLEKAAGTSNVTVTMKVTEPSGNVKYSVKVATKNLVAGKPLYIYKVDPKTGDRTLVNSKIYQVSESGSVTVNTKQNANFVLVNKASAAALNKAIKKAMTPAKASVSVKSGKNTLMALNPELNMENVKSVIYSSSRNNVAKVSSRGTIQAQRAGVAYINAKITLKNGYVKTVRMRVTVQ